MLYATLHLAFIVGYFGVSESSLFMSFSGLELWNTLLVYHQVEGS